MFDQFIDGLVDDRLQEHVLLSHQSTFGQAVQYATEFESLTRSRVKSVKKPQLAGTKVETSTAPEAASPLEEKMDSVIQCLGQLEKLIASSQGRSTRINQECFFCHQKGHFIRDCRKRKARQESSAATPARAESLNSTGLGHENQNPDPQAQS